MAEQRGHREPVGQAAHHGRFGERTQIAPAGRTAGQFMGAREQIDAGHDDQQARGDDPHAAHPALDRIETVESGGLEKVHANKMAGSADCSTETISSTGKSGSRA